MRLLYLFFTAVLIILGTLNSSASHLAGGSIRYDYMGLGSTAGTYKYKVSATVIRYCNGIQYSTTSLTQEAFWFRCQATGTTLGPFTATLVPYVAKPGERTNIRGARDISDVCRSVKTSCELSSTLGAKGYEAHTVEYTIDLPRCDSWEVRLVTGDCCRNGVVNFNTSPGNVGLETIINTSWSPPGSPLSPPNNSAPSFADEAKPMPSVCIGQNVFYGLGTVDPDGDSLRFELTCPWSASSGSKTTNPFTSMTRNAPLSPYTCAKPIDNLILDSATGLISFRTNISNQYIVAFYVSEYERCTGVLKGKTYREVQFLANACSNNPPTDISGISNLQGNVVKTGKYSFQVCEGAQISWQDTIYDPDVLDTLFFDSNVDSILKGVQYSVQSLARNMAVLNFTWTARSDGNNHKVFYVSYDDDRCDFPSNGYSGFEIEVLPGAGAGNDQTVCMGDTVFMEALGGVNYTWHSISGDPIVPGVNWFSDTTAHDTNRFVKFIPTQTTKLWVALNYVTDQCGNRVQSACNLIDTITINVADSFSIQPISDFTVCYGNGGQLGVNTSNQALNYSYKWAPSNALNYDTIKSPQFSSLDENIIFELEVSADGCVRKEEIEVSVTHPFPTWHFQASDTLVCLNDTIDLSLIGKVDYGSCETTNLTCQGITQDLVFGTGDTINDSTSNGMPIVYNTTGYSSRVRYIYKASDLIALGMEAGLLSDLAWEVLALSNNTSSIVNNFSIKISCTDGVDINDIKTKNEKLTEVYSPKSGLLRKGWNNYTFDEPYAWDGHSNLIVEVCWENLTSTTSSTPRQALDTTNYAASQLTLNYYTYRVACDEPMPSFSYSMLPKTRFTFCSQLRPELFKVNWSAGTGNSFYGNHAKLNNELLVFPGAQNSVQVIIEDSATGLCRDTLDYQINVVTQYNTKPLATGPYCILDTLDTLAAVTPPNYSNYTSKWSGLGVVDSSLGVISPIIMGVGSHWIKYEVSGDACASADSTLFEIKGKPNPTFSVPYIDSICEYETDTLLTRLIPQTPGGVFNGFGVDSITNASGKLTYFVDGKRFKPISGLYNQASIGYRVKDVCWNDTIQDIKIFATWDTTFRGTSDFGSFRMTSSFCMTSDYKDTLFVEGDNPTWELLGNPTAMIDKSRGILDPKIAGIGHAEDFIDTIVVSNTGFCGSSNTIPVQFVRAPEVEVLSKVYCDSWISDPANNFTKDTIYIRIPRGPNLGGTGAKLLGVPGNDIIVNYAGIQNTGWTNAYDAISDQYSYNYWNGQPSFSFPNIARFSPASLANRKHDLEYQFAIKYRANHRRNDKCFSRDTGYVEIGADSIDINLDPTYELCDQTSIEIDPGYYDGKYKWNTGSNARRLTALRTGVYTVTVTTEFCSGTKSTLVVGCTGIDSKLDNGVEISAYPNPVSGTLKISTKGIDKGALNIRFTDLSGKLVFQDSITDQESINSTQIDVSELKSGVYLLTLSSGENYSTYRIIVE
ncbi:MAG: T9SS type A sorting domain-containing protein [Salibacteraceae bacterium]